MANSTDIIITSSEDLEPFIYGINQAFGLQLNSCINDYESGGTRCSSFFVYAHSDSKTYETFSIRQLFECLCNIIKDKEMCSVMISSDDHGDFCAMSLMGREDGVFKGESL